MFLHLTEVEAEVTDKLNYIKETKETMDKNADKLAEIVESISGISAGKTVHDTTKSISVGESVS